ncbi:hypothetical protein GX48_05655 [Paracoccidioides brasiliensis]|nr:hypothetical protein GX48_05655 [Paracoccidioides brasiliensis]
MVTPPPAIRILPAEPKDSHALAEVEFNAFSVDPVSQVMFGKPTPEMIDFRAREFVQGMEKKDPRRLYLKAVVSEDDKIIALGVWYFYRTEEEANDIEVQDAKKKQWPAGVNVEACIDFRENIYRMRERMRGKRHAFLNVLTTDTAHQGLGAGSAMLKYGIEIADRENLPTWLEGSQKGYPLYRKFGFEDVDRFAFDLSKYGGEGERVLVGMLRSAKQD